MSEVTHHDVISHVDRKTDVCILTFRFERIKLWVCLQTKHILKWDTCKLMFCGNKNEKDQVGSHGE